MQLCMCAMSCHFLNLNLNKQEGRHETSAAAGAKGGRHCKFDQLCSVNLFRLYRACVKLSNFSWCVLTMVGSESDIPENSNRQPPAGEELRNLLRDALAATKRSRGNQ